MLNKQGINIPFGMGLDLKTDPLQVSPGKLLALKNAVFTKGGLLVKRDGFASLASLPSTTAATNLTTLSNNLLATGSNLYAYSQDTQQWFNRGLIQPVQVSTIAAVRTSTSQKQSDSALAYNGLICLAFVDTSGNLSYNIMDSSTGQAVVPNTLITATGNSPRVLLLGNYFVITFVATVAGNPKLQYLAVPQNNPSVPLAVADVSSLISSINAPYDAIVSQNRIYFAWDGSDGGGAIRSTYLTSTLLVGTPKIIAGHAATLISIAVDSANGNLYISWQESSNNGYAFVMAQDLSTIRTTTQIITSTAITQLTSIILNSILQIYYQVTNTYSYSSVRSDYVVKNTYTSAGVVGTASALLRSVGLASKPFIVNNTIYILLTYGGSFQPTYFLSDASGNIISRLAYSNGGGYNTSKVLPAATLVGNNATLTYLINDLLQAANKSQGVSNNAGIYAQTGVNLVTFGINNDLQYSSEVASSLHLTGGILWQYDGQKPVEHGFNVWPEDNLATSSNSAGGMSAQQYYYVSVYEWTDAVGNLHRSAPSVPFTATVASGTAVSTLSTLVAGSKNITVTSATGLFVGQLVTDATTPANIPANTRITAINGTTVTLSNAAVNSAASDSITTSEVGHITVNVPTLRLTYKSSTNPVRIVLYRWSASQQTYYQVSSITSPTLNSTTVDSITYVDTANDSTILGNTLLYTTGGVVENIVAPPSTASTLYQSRLFLVDAEDPNLLWYSKQIVSGTPVEMSDLFTIYIAPTAGAQGDTGPITALSVIDDKLIIFKKDAIYHLTGNGPDATGANNDFSFVSFITGTVGCSNPKSITMMPDGLMFQSDKGIWLLDRTLNTQYIGADVENYNGIQVRGALTIPGTNEVRFTLENDQVLVYDYYYKQWGTFDNIPGIASCIQNKAHTYLNSLGQVRQQKAGTYLDGSSPVLLSLSTAWLKFGGLQDFQRIYHAFLLATYISPHKLIVNISYDYVTSPSQTIVITPSNYKGPYGSDTLYGGSSPYGGPANLEQFRLFFDRQKCQSMQIEIIEQFDPSLGTVAGAGLSLSGLNVVVGVKDSKPKVSAAQSKT
jgi:hypothetical protein